MNYKCHHCRFFDAFKESEGGRCRRYPPTLFSVDNIPWYQYPHVDTEDWCGEFQQKSVVPSTITDFIDYQDQEISNFDV